MTTMRPVTKGNSVETLVESYCSRVVFSGLHKTLLEAPDEQAATQAVINLRTGNHVADHRFDPKHGSWQVIIIH